ncbi:MAG: hypothetical protein ACRERR_02450 [Moraxellaceae bacterium]
MSNIPNPSPLDEKLSEKLSLPLRDRFDRLFIQQLVARQFMQDYPEAHQKLLDIRNAIHGYIRKAGINPLAGETEAQTLITLMSIYESASGRAAIAKENLDHITANYPLDPTLGIRLHKNGLCRVISDMAQHLETVNSVQSTYNHFDYFSLIDMTAAFAGPSAFDFYVRAALGDAPTYTAIKAQNLRPEANWFNTRKAPDDLELAIALMRSRHLRHLHSPNISLSGRTLKDDLKAGKPGYSSLIIEINLDKAPDNIDHATRILRECLMDGLLTRHGIAANIEGFNDFIESDFFKSTSSTSAFVQKWNQIQGPLIGIWCWDILTQKNEPTLDKAKERISEAQRITIATAKGSSIDLKAIGEKAIENHYYTAKRLIERNGEIDELSYFVTGSKSILLGERRP